jgi:hypothetical protein
VLRSASRFLVLLLALGASGVPDLFIPEPCQIGESSTADDGNCAATCVRCGCCAQPTDLFHARPTFFTLLRTDYAPVTVPDLLLPDAREILHVPKLARL